MTISLMDVGPRDGLQNEKQILPVEIKADLVNRLADAGLKRIETGSFVSPKWVPQMADSDAVFQLIHRSSDVEYSALIPNLKGMEKALQVQADRVSVFTAASEAFCQKNTNCSIDESLSRFIPVLELAREHGIPARGYVSCVAGCPYQGAVDIRDVVHVAERLFEIGCDEISLGDTIGTGTPHHIRTIVSSVAASIPVDRIGIHCHDTYGQALVNTYAALEAGIRIVDASVGGLGGCPYAKGATGNLATEDLVYMLEGNGVDTGIDLDKLIETGDWICQYLGFPSRAKVSAATSKKK